MNNLNIRTTDQATLAIARDLLSILATDCVLTPQEHHKRETAVTVLPEMIEQFNLNELPIDFLTTAYMTCSYAESPNKHNIKPVINRMFAREMREFGIEENKNLAATIAEQMEVSNGQAKPVVMVVTNWFNASHAVYRCFAKSIAGLKRAGFHVVQLALGGSDPATHYLFDHVIICDMQPSPDFLTNIEGTAREVKRINPDVLLYTDIAMHPVSIFLSNLRLAPIQCVMGGHPVSSYSNVIDHFIIEDSLAFACRGFSEHIATFPEKDYALILPEYEQAQTYLPQRRNPRILVPATCPKLSVPFLETCAEIVRRVPGSEIFITTNAMPEQMAQMRIAEKIRAIVPDANIYPALTFKDLHTVMRECDMFLMPFPFAGTNLTVDCMINTLPGITFSGGEFLSETAPSIMHRAGCPMHGLVATTRDEYIECAVELAEFEYERQALREVLQHTYHRGRKMNLPLFADECNGLANTLKGLLNE